VELNFSEEEKSFREEVAAWLRANVPAEARPLENGPEMRRFDTAWQKKQYEAGYGGIPWPVEFGGKGLSLTKQLIWYEEYATAGAPYVGSMFVGLNHAGPTLIAKGSHEQKLGHLPRILRGEEIWCQGFSEPGAGSDLASLSTRGRVEGDELIVNGQKVWTSYAQMADFQELLVRTGPQDSRHKGISWVICDMRSPGITVRPIETMHGDHHFCEVFYDDVRIPLANVVGEINDGWTVAMATLSFERGTAFIADQVELSRTVERLVETAAERGLVGNAESASSTEVGIRLGTVRAEVAALRAMTLASVSRVAVSGQPGPDGSIVRLFHALLGQKVHRLAMDILHGDALVLPDLSAGTSWPRWYLRSFGWTIGGGTAEVQKSIIAERLLGLPRSR
jgi:alkylation response protein AidB-like acyl-CoA dehydrogenase